MVIEAEAAVLDLVILMDLAGRLLAGSRADY